MARRSPNILILLLATWIFLLAAQLNNQWSDAWLQIQIGVPGNTFSTQTVFTGTRSVQTGTTVSDGLGVDIEILWHAIDTSLSFLIFNTRHNDNEPSNSMVRGRIASANTVEFGRMSNDIKDVYIDWYVVEYNSGIRVQRGEVKQTSNVVDVHLTTSVAAIDQAFITWSKTPNSVDVGWDEDDPLTAELTAVDNLRFRADTLNAEHIIWWQVIEFLDPAEVLVQKGKTFLTGGDLDVTVNLPTGVDISKSFALVGYNTDGFGNDVGARMLRGHLVDGNNLLIDRSIAGDDDITEIVWHVIELNDGTKVKRGTTSFAIGETEKAVAIAAVDSDAAVPFSAVQPVGGQNMGKSPYNADTIIGVGSATMMVTSDTELTITRENSAETAEFGWFVVEFGD